MAKKKFSAIRLVPQQDGVTVDGISRSARGSKFYSGSVKKKGKVKTKKELKSLYAQAIKQLMGED